MNFILNKNLPCALRKTESFWRPSARMPRLGADEAEVNALKGGKKAMIKMETRIRELESELDAENRRLGDANKNLRKTDRKVKELTFSADEGKKNHERMLNGST